MSPFGLGVVDPEVVIQGGDPFVAGLGAKEITEGEALAVELVAAIKGGHLLWGDDLGLMGWPMGSLLTRCEPLCKFVLGDCFELTIYPPSFFKTWSILSVSLPCTSNRTPHASSPEGRIAERGLEDGSMWTNRTLGPGMGLLERPRNKRLGARSAGRRPKGAHWLELSPVEDSLPTSSSEEDSSYSEASLVGDRFK